MIRRRQEDTEPSRATDTTEPGPLPSFDPADPAPPPTEAEVKNLDRLLSALDRPPTRIVPYQLHRASSDGASAAAYSTTAEPQIASRQASPRDLALVELGELARRAGEIPAPGSDSRQATTRPPMVVPKRSRRATALWLGIPVATIGLVVGISFATHQPVATPRASAVPASPSASSPAIPSVPPPPAVIPPPPPTASLTATPSIKPEPPTTPPPLVRPNRMPRATVSTPPKSNGNAPPAPLPPHPSPKYEPSDTL